MKKTPCGSSSGNNCFATNEKADFFKSLKSRIMKGFVYKNPVEYLLWIIGFHQPVDFSGHNMNFKI